MATGKVKFYSVDKGSGLIAQDGGGMDAVVLYPSIVSMEPLKVGQAVRYEVTMGPKGPVAEMVEVVA